MFINLSPRSAWSFGLPQDTPFIWTGTDAPPTFTPPPLHEGGLDEGALNESPHGPATKLGLLAPLLPADLDALPPTELPATPQAFGPAPGPITMRDVPPPDWVFALLPPPTRSDGPPEFQPAFPPPAPPGSPELVALLDALWAARPPLPEVPPQGLVFPELVPPSAPPPFLAWSML